jgi:hypothetical protein
MQIFAANIFNRGSLMDECTLGPAPQYQAGPSLTDAVQLERRGLEAQLNRAHNASIETLRLALRRYRSLSKRSPLY